MKGELICPKCNRELCIETKDQFIFLKCSDKKCTYKSVIDMDCE